MRLASVFAGLTVAIASLVGAAWADVTCYGGARDAVVGEVGASLDLNSKTGKAGAMALFWTPERSGGAEEGGNVAWPGLMLDYQLDREGVLTGPSAAEVMISRVSRFAAGEARVAAARTSFRVRAAAPGVDVLTWGEADQAAGHRRLAKLLRDAKPATLKIELLGSGDAVAAYAEFDFSRMGKVAELAASARDEAERGAAAYRAALGRGETLQSCPAG